METAHSNTPKAQPAGRSLKHCIVEGWKTFALHTGAYVKYLWAHLLVAGIGFAIAATLFRSFCTQYLQPQLTYTHAGFDPALAKALFSPTAGELLLYAAALLALLVAVNLMYGAIFSQIRFFAATDSLPATGPFTFWGEVRKDAFRALRFNAAWWGVTAACCALVAFTAWKTSLWLLLLLLPVLLYSSVVGNCGRLLYVVGKRSFRDAVRGAFSVGHHRFGGYFIILMLVAIPVYLLAIALGLPALIIHLSAAADTISQLAGDPSGIPPYVFYLYFATAALGFAGYGLLVSLRQWPLALYTLQHCPVPTQQPDAQPAADAPAAEEA